MTTQQQGILEGWSGAPGGMWLDGLDGQEDELEDVAEGRLDPSTDTEGSGSTVIRPNSEGVALEEADELEDEVTHDLESLPPLH